MYTAPHFPEAKNWPALRRPNACQQRSEPSLWPEHTGPALGREGACRPLRANWENAGRTRSHAEQAESSPASPAQGTALEIQESRGHYPRTSVTLTTGK